MSVQVDVPPALFFRINTFLISIAKYEIRYGVVSSGTKSWWVHSAAVREVELLAESSHVKRKSIWILFINMKKNINL